MADAPPPAFDLIGTYVHLEDGGAAAPVVCDADFWPALISGQRRYDGRLVMASRMTESTAHWEMHPQGEEFLYLLSGAVDVVLEEAAGERRVALRRGTACLVPRGTWHRVEVREPGELLFITYGEGTQHRRL